MGLLNAEQAAELLNVPVSFVRQETRAERMPYIALGARYKRYDADELEQWWRSRARGPWRDRGAAAAEARRVAS
jgi:excisionase family DNA binding protein